MKGIDLYKKVVIEQDKSYIDKRFKSGEQEIEITDTWCNPKIDIKNKSECTNIFSCTSPSEVRDFMTSDWQEVKRPVSLLEALQAWANKEKVVCFLDGNKTVYDGNYLLLKDTNNSTLSRREIIDGTWYIGEV